jgi:C1A family cysteine protease
MSRNMTIQLTNCKSNANLDFYHTITHYLYIFNKNRKIKFHKNLIKINEHNTRYNNGTETYYLGATLFADMDAQEYAAFASRSGLISPPINSNVTKISETKSGVSAPASIDWRNYNGRNYVQAIKNQGGCGSCWAFSAVSALESYSALLGGNIPNLSEQNLVDCTYSYNGCIGGYVTDAWQCVKNNGGIAVQSIYPYNSGSTNRVKNTNFIVI